MPIVTTLLNIINLIYLDHHSFLYNRDSHLFHGVNEDMTLHKVLQFADAHKQLGSCPAINFSFGQDKGLN